MLVGKVVAGFTLTGDPPTPQAQDFDATTGKALWKHTLPGNANTGHQFRNDGGAGVIGPELSDTERYEIIEYLKVMGNPAFGDPPDAALPGPPTCPKTLQGPAGSGP